MNYIKKLSAVGLKSGDFSHELSPVTLICGSSFSGKTSMLQAIRLNLAGYEPALGKTAAATAKLARNGAMSITLEDDEGRVRSCAFGKKSGGKATADEAWAVPTVLLDPNEYFGLSDRKKLDYVFSLYRMEDSPEFSGDGVLAAIKGIRLDNHTEEHEASFRDILELIDQSDRERHDSGLPIQLWIETQIEGLKERLKLAKAACDRMTKTVQGITQINATEAPAPTVAADLAEKKARALEVAKHIGQLEAALATYRGLVAKGERLKAQVEIMPITDVPVVATKEMQAESIRLGLEISSHKSRLADATRVLAIVQTELSHDERFALEISKGIEALEEELAEKLKTPCCPTCGTPTEAFKDKLQELHKITLAEPTRKWQEAIKRISSYEIQIRKLQDDVSHAKKADGLVALKRVESERLKNQVYELNQKVLTAQRANETRDRLSAELTAVMAEISASSPENLQECLAGALAESDQLELSIATLEAQQRAWQRQQDDEQRNAAALQEHAAGLADVEATKAAVAELEKIQAAMVRAAFDSILQTVNRVTGGIVREPIDYREGEIGRWRGGTWISHETFSGTEKALTYAGLALALAKDSRIKLVMLDEMGIMDEQTFETVVRRMAALVKSGVIGQFIGCCSAPKSIDGIAVISL